MDQSLNRKRTPPVPRPSASVILISPTNQVLLLHRVRTSSSFPSAHVFPGGNLSATHDGDIPAVDDPARHRDGEAYRVAAIRETFEESGILLARNAGFGRLIELDDEEREKGRRAVHAGEVPFLKWLAQKGGYADTDGLIPFTRWITPTNIPKRFTTQMYVYFLPPASNPSTSTSVGPLPFNTEATIPVPTHDGGIEHTEASFRSPSTWLSMSSSGQIILFPPQVYLLHLISPFLSPHETHSTLSSETLSQQRKALLDFLNDGSNPGWAEMCISPEAVLKSKIDGRVVLGLDKPGRELEGSGRKGDGERVVYVDFRKEGPRNVEVALRKEAFERERKAKL